MDQPVSAGKTQTAFACLTPPQLPATLNVSDYYTDAAHSIVDPKRKQAYDDATRNLRSAARAIIDMADRYRSSGDTAVAACTARFLVVLLPEKLCRMVIRRTRPSMCRAGCSAPSRSPG